LSAEGRVRPALENPLPALAIFGSALAGSMMSVEFPATMQAESKTPVIRLIRATSVLRKTLRFNNL
jgi:hypothetical protein